MAEVTMPRLSDTMQEGTIAEWVKKEGERVEKGDVLLEIETDKATMTQESYEAGVLEKILVQAGETVAIGTVIAVIGTGAAKPAAPSQPAAPAAATGQGSHTPPSTGEAPAPVSSQANAAAVSPAASQSVAEGAAPPTFSPAPVPIQAAPASSGTAPGNGQNSGERVKASPLAKKIAAERGVQLQGIKGSGPNGRIVSNDVLSAGGAGKVETRPPATAAPPAGPGPSAQPTPAAEGASSGYGGRLQPDTPSQQPSPAAPPPQAPSAAPAQTGTAYEDKDVSRMRQTIARRLTEAKQQIPHIYISNEIDMGEALKLRKTINSSLEKEGGPKVSVNDMVIKAVAKALKKFPGLNTSFLGNQIRFHQRINISSAVALPDGLITPVIYDADQKSISQIAAESRSLIEKAKAGKLRPDEYQGGTFGISNLGMYDVTNFTAVINPPNAGILAVGAVKPTPVVMNGTDDEAYNEVTVAQIMQVTISVDHRAADGAVAATFLQELKKILQNPFSLLV